MCGIYRNALLQTSITLDTRNLVRKLNMLSSIGAKIVTTMRARRSVRVQSVRACPRFARSSSSLFVSVVDVITLRRCHNLRVVVVAVAVAVVVVAASVAVAVAVCVAVVVFVVAVVVLASLGRNVWSQGKLQHLWWGRMPH